MQYAHDKKLIHRDIKPENMLFDQRNTVVLSDFGIALLAQSSHSLSTQEVAGTAAYMAPEQFQGKPRRASDQYALGVVVYEWLSGALPFHGSFSEMASQHLFVPPPPLRQKVPAISLDVEQVVLKALEKDPLRRFESVQAFAAALERTCQKVPSLQDAPSSEVIPPSELPLSGGRIGALLPTQLPSPTNVVTPSSQYLPPTFGTIPVHTPDVSFPFIKEPVPSEKSQTLGPLQRRISRRAVVMGLGGLVGVSVVGCGITWLARSQRPQGSSRVATSTAEARTTVTSATDVYARAVATSGVMFGFDAEHTHANPYERILNPTTVSGLTKRWAYQAGNGINSSPAVVGGVAYVGSQDHNLYAIDAISGVKKWAYQTENIIYSSPAVVGGVVYIGSLDGNLYAIDAVSGTKKWTYQTGNGIYSSPTVADGVVYASSADRSLYAIDAVSGVKKWVYQTDSYITSSPAVADGVVYVGSYDKSLYAIDVASGIKKWAYQTGDHIDFSSPTVVGGVIYVGSQDHNLYAIEVVSGVKKWAYQTRSYIDSSPAVADGVVYIGSVKDHSLYAIDAASGSLKWTYQTGGDIESSPTIAGGVVYISSRDGSLYAIDAASGSLKWTYQTGNIIDSCPAVADGMVYVGSQDHNLYAFYLPDRPS